MATLISAYAPDGTRLGACDARCYNGTDDRCRCICGGRNHGVGLQQAARNVLQMTDIHPDGLSMLMPLKDLRVYRDARLAQWAKQPTLFDLLDDRAESVQEQLHGA